MKRLIALLTSVVTAASCAFAFTSCGDDRLYMPDLSGIDYTKAVEQFDFLEFQINAEAQSSTVIKGKIMEQNIRPGAKISSGQKVLLTISSGEDNPHVYKDGVDTGETMPATTTAVTETSTTTAETTTAPATTTLGEGQFLNKTAQSVAADIADGGAHDEIDLAQLVLVQRVGIGGHIYVHRDDRHDTADDTHMVNEFILFVQVKTAHRLADTHHFLTRIAVDPRHAL